MQPEETPREASETTEHAAELDGGFTFGAASEDFASSDDDDTGDIEIVVPSGFEAHEPDPSDDAVPNDEPELDPSFDLDEDQLGLALGDELALDDDDLGLYLDDDEDDLGVGLAPEGERGLETDDELNLDADDDVELETDDEMALDADVELDTDADVALDTDDELDLDGDDRVARDADDDGRREPIASMPDRAIDDWISNSHEDAHANWLDQAEKGTRSTVIAVILIAILIAVVAIAFILATKNSV